MAVESTPNNLVVNEDTVDLIKQMFSDSPEYAEFIIASNGRTSRFLEEVGE